MQTTITTTNSKGVKHMIYMTVYGFTGHMKNDDKIQTVKITAVNKEKAKLTMADFVKDLDDVGFGLFIYDENPEVLMENVVYSDRG